MKVVTIAAPKGGSMKSATTCLLAVRATVDRQRVCMIDLNVDQASLTQWHISRGKPNNPHLERDIEHITSDVQAIRHDRKFDWLFIDTPPAVMDVIENAVVVADAVVIPVRASIFDIGSMDALVEMCREHRKPFKYLLSATDHRKGFKGLTEEARITLAEDGDDVVFTQSISYRLAYINALTVGKVGPEIEPELKDEANKLWAEVQALVQLRRIERGVQESRRVMTEYHHVDESESPIFDMRAAKAKFRQDLNSSKKARKARQKAVNGAADGRSLRATGRTEHMNWRALPEIKAALHKHVPERKRSLWLEEAILAKLKDEGFEFDA